MITRIAPTPSGYVHLGNAVNFRLVDWLARANDGATALRIDDMDAVRFRPEYVDDIFGVLHWLDIDWAVGPRDRDDFVTNFAQAPRTAYFRTELEAAIGRGLRAYACTCSRSKQQAVPTGGCVGRCWERSLVVEPGSSALRVRVPIGTAVDVGGRSVRLDEAIGDFIVWRRDDVPAYQLASVVLDRDLGVTHIVRGVDLVDSSAAQLFLAPFLDAPAFEGASFLHHELVVGPDGTKLSKSRNEALSVLDRSEAARRVVDERARSIGELIGIGPT